MERNNIKTAIECLIIVLGVVVVYHLTRKSSRIKDNSNDGNNLLRPRPPRPDPRRPTIADPIPGPPIPPAPGQPDF